MRTIVPIGEKVVELRRGWPEEETARDNIKAAHVGNGNRNVPTNIPIQPRAVSKIAHRA